MEVIINGNANGRNKAFLEEFVAKVGTSLMGKRLADRCLVEITFVKDLKANFGHEGNVIWEDDDYRPREFSMELDPDLNDRSLLRAIVHEMVHVKQYAKDELRQLHTKPYYRFKGKYYPWGMAYADRPWEKEAYFIEENYYG
jgi:hypothetical protein